MASDKSTSTVPPADELVEAELIDHPPTDELAVRDDADLDKPEQPDEPQWDDDDKDWAYRFIEYKGDRLAVRRPTKQALAAFSLGSSKFVKLTTQNNVTGMFVERHLSEASYDRMISRMMDPDDPDYGPKSIGEIMGQVVRLKAAKGEDEESDDDAGDTKK